MIGFIDNLGISEISCSVVTFTSSTVVSSMWQELGLGGYGREENGEFPSDESSSVVLIMNTSVYSYQLALSSDGRAPGSTRMSY